MISIRQDPDRKHKQDLMQTVKGVGPDHGLHPLCRFA